MSATDFDVDLTNCDREPIHKLGQIQDFGALLAVNADWMIVHYSANFGEIVPTRSQIASGMPLVSSSSA